MGRKVSWVYWKEECKLYKNENCGYRENTVKLREDLGALEKSAKGVYGTFKFNCDYFEYDETKDHKQSDGCCQG